MLDVTWGLAGTTNGILFHLVNFLWAGHADDPCRGAHRYRSGFRFKAGFAVTQGSVMSNLGSSSGNGLFKHENTHVWQNRIFGPLFALSYLGWMAIFFIPGRSAGAVKKNVSLGDGIERWCCYNNPWEAWAYRVGAGPRPTSKPCLTCLPLLA